MDKKNFVMKEIAITLIALTIVVISSVKVVSAQMLYGCPKDEIVMKHPGVCPDGSNSVTLKEAYVPEGDRAIIDTLSSSEKSQLGIRKDNKIIIVVYTSPATGEVSFAPGKDKSGNTLARKAIELKYGCANNSIIASRPLFSDCLPLSDFGKNSRDLAKEKNVLNLKAKNAEAQIRESMKRSITESQPIFYSQLKQSGFSDEEIKVLWEQQKKSIYEQYNYNPETDSFISGKTN